MSKIWVDIRGLRLSAFVQLAIWNTAVPQLILPPWAGCQEKMAAARTICNYTSDGRAIGWYVCEWGRKSAHVTACMQGHMKETLINDLICEMSVLSMSAVVNCHDPSLLQTINHQTTSVPLWDQATKLIIYLREHIRNIISHHQFLQGLQCTGKMNPLMNHLYCAPLETVILHFKSPKLFWCISKGL